MADYILEFSYEINKTDPIKHTIICRLHYVTKSIPEILSLYHHYKKGYQDPHDIIISKSRDLLRDIILYKETPFGYYMEEGVIPEELKKGLAE